MAHFKWVKITQKMTNKSGKIKAKIAQNREKWSKWVKFGLQKGEIMQNGENFVKIVKFWAKMVKIGKTYLYQN